jgi:drug/metabolite transporter (DMT)-like permease
MQFHPIALALAAAGLFGLSTPACKVLLGTVDPSLLAGLLYCGAGVGIGVLRRLTKWVSTEAEASEAKLTPAEIPWLAGAIVAGGIIGPLLLMTGLARTDAATASLLLTLEGVATALIAWFVFRENFDRRIALGMLCLVAGAGALSWSGQPTIAGLLGPLAIIGACVAWGIDNNLTRKVSLADPLQIVELKGLVAGPVNLMIGLASGAAAPPLTSVALAGLVGFFGIGVSLAVFVVALRHLGAARTGAYFSTAPFIGGIGAVIAIGEPLSAQLLVAGVLMAIGVWLHVTEHHEHEHVHEALEHSHRHVHDEHHRHEHGSDDPAGEPHVHRHRHEPLRHKHAHTPDMHHIHDH